MAYPNYDPVINVEGVGWGASGTTGLLGATRVMLPDPSILVRRGRAGGDKMPRFVRATGVAMVRVTVETEDLSEYLAAMALIGGTKQKLTINYIDSGGNVKLQSDTTTANAHVVGVNEVRLPPREEAGQAPRYTITFELEITTGGSTPATDFRTCFTKSANHASLS